MQFANHLREIFRRRGEPAAYSPAGGAAISCTAIRQGGGEGIQLGAVRVVLERTRFHVLRAELTSPAAGGVLSYGGASWTIEAVQPVESDPDRLMWSLEADWGALIDYRSSTGSGTTQSPPQGSGFQVAEAASAGADEVTIGAGFAVGQLVAGDAFTIAGDATVYTVTGAVTAASNRFTGAGITPALAEDAAEGAAVTFDFARDFTVRAAVSGYEASEILGGVQFGDRRLVILQAALDAASLADAPKAGDRVTFEGRVFSVVSAKALYQGAAAVAWDVQVRG